jgi:hypothetical protein
MDGDLLILLSISSPGPGMRILISVLALSILLSACANYRTPGSGAALGVLTQPGTTANAGLHPAAVFPARLALVRVQDTDYATTGSHCFGTGRYCVVTVRSIESDDDIRRLQQLPQVAGLVDVPRMVLPVRLDSVDDLRAVVARLHADLLLLYTLDTRFTLDRTQLDPLAEISPGFLPNRNARVTTRTSAVLIDVPSGFVYGSVEATAWRDQNAAVWATRTAIEDERRMTEHASFERMLDKFASVWHDVLVNYGMGNR